MNYLSFVQTHKNNFWNNLRLGRKGRKWIREYEDKNCDTFDEDCSKCMLHHWCMTCDSSWYEWTHPWEFITTLIKNWLENRLWGWYKNHPGKKIRVCSICELRERGSYYYLITYAGWQKEHHKWVCHHCWGHAFDDVSYETQEDISHKDYEKQWENYVKEHNKEV